MDSQASGKKMFLCTNSTFQYIDAGLKFMIGDDWRALFEVVIVSARKPDFYTRHRDFRLLEPDIKQVQVGGLVVSCMRVEARSVAH